MPDATEPTIPPSQPSPGLKVATLGGVPVYIGRTWPVIAVIIVVDLRPVDQQQPARPRPAGLPRGGRVLGPAAGLGARARGGPRRRRHPLRLPRQPRGGRPLGRPHGVRHGAEPAGPERARRRGRAARPTASIAAGSAGCWRTGSPGGVPALLVGAVVWTNGFVALFNLLPGLPLDGGFLVDALVWRVTGNRDLGLIAAGWCGRAVTVLVLALGAAAAVRAGLPALPVHRRLGRRHRRLPVGRRDQRHPHRPRPERPGRRSPSGPYGAVPARCRRPAARPTPGPCAPAAWAAPPSSWWPPTAPPLGLVDDDALLGHPRGGTAGHPGHGRGPPAARRVGRSTPSPTPPSPPWSRPCRRCRSAPYPCVRGPAGSRGSSWPATSRRRCHEGPPRAPRLARHE